MMGKYVFVRACTYVFVRMCKYGYVRMSKNMLVRVSGDVGMRIILIKLMTDYSYQYFIKNYFIAIPC
jgi:hypothetical protein